ncbi:aminodeoxychorismate synthase component I [Desulfococcus sp.]|uniref:aminodeoxychorismate synthase component I n=1 Tax=Desulfococcus sp. TaxID=2025834 RepID=UPI00359329ED
MKERGTMPVGITGVREIAIDIQENFLAFAGRFAHTPGTVLLMSGGGLDCARHHILGVHPWLTISGRGKRLTMAWEGGQTVLSGNPFDTLRGILDRFRLQQAPPDTPVAAGLLGYLAYDLKDAVEALPRTAVDDLCLPHLYLALPSLLVVHDKSTGRTRLFMPEGLGCRGDWAAAHLAWFTEKMSAPLPEEGGFRGNIEGFASNFRRPEYMDAVGRIKSYIGSGDVYQVNLSQRFTTDFEGDPFALFQRLYRRNPAPFYAYIHARDHHIVSTSPERFIFQNGRDVETRPIKGTRPRGKTPAEDEAMARELRTSPKDDAELSMIVDLLRNDIGKVCAAGSVRVTEHKRLEPYQNVYHLVSTVTGTLDDGHGSVDLIRAAFPGGSITGCPKIRSMEIIDELEPNRRHIYTGAIGYISFHDTMDLSIAIRTATLHNGRMIFSVGGGVVYDSDPSDEFEETLHKGETLLSVFQRDGGATQVEQAWAWVNGKMVPMACAVVPAAHPGAQYGHGIFETIRVDRGVPRYLSEHIDRFNRAWTHLLPGESPDLAWDLVIRRVIEKNRLETGIAAVKIMVFKGSREQAPFDHTLVVTARSYVHRLTGRETEGVRLITYPHPRETPLADYKTLNYLYYLQAGHWARDRGGDEALILNPDRTVSETHTANILLFKGRDVLRPQSAHVLPGVTARVVCEYLGREGYRFRTVALRPEDLLDMDLVLLTNSLMGAVPAVSLDGQTLAVSRELLDAVCRATS